MPRYRSGSSLPEAIATVALIGFVVVALAGLVLILSRSQRYAWEQGSAIQEGRRAVAALAQAIRSATYGEDGSYPLVAVQPFSLTLYSDIDRDGLVERVRFWLEGTTLRRAVAEPVGQPLHYGQEGAPEIIAQYVRNGEDATPIFVAFDANGTPLADPVPVLAVRTIRVTLVVNVGRNRAPGDFTLSTTARLRNTRLSR